MNVEPHARHPKAVESEDAGHAEVPVPPHRKVVGRDPSGGQLQASRDPFDRRRPGRGDELEAVEVHPPFEDGPFVLPEAEAATPILPSRVAPSRNGVRSAASIAPTARAWSVPGASVLEASGQAELALRKRPGGADRPVRGEANVVPRELSYRPPEGRRSREGDGVRADDGRERQEPARADATFPSESRRNTASSAAVPSSAVVEGIPSRAE